MRECHIGSAGCTGTGSCGRAGIRAAIDIAGMNPERAITWETSLRPGEN